MQNQPACKDKVLSEKQKIGLFKIRIHNQTKKLFYLNQSHLVKNLEQVQYLPF